MISTYTKNGLVCVIIDEDGDIMLSFCPFKNKGEEYIEFINNANIDFEKIINFLENEHR